LFVAIATAFAAHAQVTASADYLARMDADHDGVLAPAEQPGGRGKPITREAHRARLADAFSRQDKNHDGMLSAAELAAPPR